MHYRFKSSMLNGNSGKVSRGVKRVIVRAVNRGLYVTSTRGGVHASTSYHYSGKAVDVGAKTQRPMTDFQRFLVRRFGCHSFLELFGPDNTLACKDGRPITLDEGSDLENLHDNHVHVAPSRVLALPVRPAKLIAKLRRARSIAAAKRAGAKYAAMIYDEAEKAGISYPLALALVKKESNFINQFGHDRDAHGKVIFIDTAGRVLVSADKVRRYLSFARRTGLRQGVGLTQLTAGPYQSQAEARGGLHRPRVQLSVGFDALAGHIKALGKRRGIGAYNGGRGNPQLDYADSVIKLEDDFRKKGVK
jgi:hypothetical protein